MVGDAVFSPGLEHDVDSFPEARVALLPRHVEGPELGHVEAASGSPVHAPAREHVEQGDLLGQAQRMVERRKGYRCADAQVARPSRHVHAHEMHGRAHAVRVEVVLREPDGVVAGLIHDVDALERALVYRLEGYAPLGPAEELKDAGLHATTALRVRWSITTATLSSCSARVKQGAGHG